MPKPPSRARADADGCGHAWCRAGTLILAAAGDLQRADEAGGIARREQLFGIGALAAGAAEFLRGGELDVEAAVLGPGVAVATAGGGGAGAIEDIDRHALLLT